MGAGSALFANYDANVTATDVLFVSNTPKGGNRGSVPNPRAHAGGDGGGFGGGSNSDGGLGGINNLLNGGGGGGTGGFGSDGAGGNGTNNGGNGGGPSPGLGGLFKPV